MWAASSIPSPRQGGEADPSTRRDEANLDRFRRRASFEGGCWILNENICSRHKTEPRKGGEVKMTPADTAANHDGDFGRDWFGRTSATVTSLY